ncbi:MAG: preprotein translocase subunit SecE [Firmicutes bacterium]|uniref:Protein translocase subunit SecE n=1 Tax=Candidatus Scybalomonas excrementavium TaxID=2840943 RepID=A0A9D9I0J9_9FIRM|nr:preprotein translocase subunit SecE [Candidatus Scybalomonas excrementavium]
MGETGKTEKTPKKSWLKGLKAEFSKIVWPKKNTIAKETGVVLVVAIILGVAVAVFDFFVQYGMDLLIK